MRDDHDAHIERLRHKPPTMTDLETSADHAATIAVIAGVALSQARINAAPSMRKTPPALHHVGQRQRSSALSMH